MNAFIFSFLFSLFLPLSAEPAKLTPSQEARALLRRYPVSYQTRRSWQVAVKALIDFADAHQGEKQYAGNTLFRAFLLYLDVARLEEAAELAQRFLKHYPEREKTCIAILKRLAGSEASRGRYEIARWRYRRIQKEYAYYELEAASACYREAATYLYEKNPKAAIEGFLKTIQNFPTQLSVRWQAEDSLMNLYRQERMWDETAKTCEQIIKRGDNRTRVAHARFRVGEARLLQGNFNDAKTSFLEVLALHPLEWEPCRQSLQQLSLTYIHLDRIDEALAAARILYSLTQFDRDTSRDAVDACARALKARDGHLGNIGLFLKALNRSSRKDERKASKKGNQEEPRIDIASVYPITRFKPDAQREKLFKKSLTAQPTDPNGYRARGYLHLYLDQPLEAGKAFQAAMLIADSFSSTARCLPRDKEIEERWLGK